MADHNERWVLNHLIEMCRDEEVALRYAADHVTSTAVRGMLVTLADQRARFAEDLQPHAHGLGGAEAADSTTRGRLHQGWLSLKNRLMKHTDTDMISEAAHAEERVLATYRSMLNEMLPPRAREVVEEQCEQIAEAQNRLRGLQPPH